MLGFPLKSSKIFAILYTIVQPVILEGSKKLYARSSEKFLVCIVINGNA